MGVKSGLHQNLARNSSELEKSRWPKLGIPFLGVRCKKCAFFVQFATQNFDYLRTVDTNNFSVGANSALKFCGAPTGINKSTSTKFERAIHIKSKFMTKIIWQKIWVARGCALIFLNARKMAFQIWAVRISRVRTNFGLRFGGDLAGHLKNKVTRSTALPRSFSEIYWGGKFW